MASIYDQNARSMERISEMMDELKSASEETRRLMESFQLEGAWEGRQEVEISSEPERLPESAGDGQPSMS